jgi:hypothetical protein
MKINNPSFLFCKIKWEYIYNYLQKIEEPCEIIKGKRYYNQITFENTIRKTNNEFTRRYGIDGNKFYEKLRLHYKELYKLDEI